MTLDNAETPAGLHDLEAEYEILGELGRGGMAVVYRARDRALRREVAIKVIRARYAEDDEALARFAREARTVAKLQHPHVVSVHSVRRLGDKSVALIMQYVPGGTVKEALAAEGPFSPQRAEQVLRDVAEALACAHAQGIVHRDIKPENIFLDETSGRALLSDFGIATSQDSDTQLTLAGIALGTPAYMSPEQIDGVEVDGRSDLYSLGLVGWEMLTGKRPWEGESLYSIIYKQKNEELPPLREVRPDLPGRLEFAIDGALRKEREARWRTAEEFREQLLETTLAAKRRRWLEARRRRAAAPVPVADEQVEPAALAAATIRYRRPEGAGLPAPRAPVSVPAVRSRFMVIAAAALLLLVGSAAVIWAFSRNDLPAGDTEVAGVPPAAQWAVTPHFPQPPEAAETTALPAEVAVDTAQVPDLLTEEDSTAEQVGPVAAAAEPAAPPPPPADTSAPEPAAAPPREAPAPAPPAPAAASEEPAAPAGAVSVVAGGVHTCMLAADGGAFCWGGNDRGQLGDQSRTRRQAPLRIAGDHRFQALAAGVSHTCGVTRSGETFCWGANDGGQLGDGTSTSTRTAPAPLAGNLRMQRVWLGSSHTCGITRGGDAYCWGRNAHGQLGDGGMTDQANPVQVASSTRFSSLAVGWNHTCALTRQGSVFCWGQNASGQLGDGARSDRSLPAPISGEYRFASIAAGSSHTCGLTSSGELYCWGRNSNGQLGDGSTTDREVPGRVGGGESFASVTAGSVHTCALNRRGEAFCWGRNNYGQLGDGSTTDRATAVRVQGNHRFANLHASGAHTCGATRDGETLCWGYNVEGQLGDGTRSHRTRPVSAGKP